MGKNDKKKYDPDNVYNNIVKFVIELFYKIKKKIIKFQYYLKHQQVKVVKCVGI